MTARRRWLGIVAALAIGGCGGGDEPAVDPDAAAATVDAADLVDAGDLDGAPDAGGGCATQVLPTAQITGTEGLAIAVDGTTYFSKSGAVGRWRPGQAAPENAWVTLPGTTTVWGMALGPGGILYVATPANTGTIWRIDTSDATPTATVYFAGANSPNGLIVGPDGAVYYTSFVAAGHVHRVARANVRTTVTTTAIAQPNGLLFEADGSLLVASYGNGTVYRLMLDGNQVELGAMRMTVADRGTDDTGSPDGLARDVQGRYYLTDNAGRKVLRFGAGPRFGAREELLTGVGGAANMAFARGALGCTDLYVTSSGPLRRITVDVTGVP